MKRELARFWYRFKNWFRTKPAPGEPLTFLCGSEEELRRVTTWMCHANEKVFLEQKKTIVFYHAATPYCKARVSSQPIKLIHSFIHEPLNHEWKYILQWSTVILEHNQFTGTYWDFMPEMVCHFPEMIGNLPMRGLPQWFHVCEIPLTLEVTVHPPSAHERAEALLALSEWLDGKVSEQEKRELLQLPNDVEI